MSVKNGNPRRRRTGVTVENLMNDAVYEIKGIDGGVIRMKMNDKIWHLNGRGQY